MTTVNVFNDNVNYNECLTINLPMGKPYIFRINDTMKWQHWLFARLKWNNFTLPVIFNTNYYYDAACTDTEIDNSRDQNTGIRRDIDV